MSSNNHHPIILAIDVMSGDHAPYAALDAALGFAQKNSQVQFLLVGQEKIINAYLNKNRLLAVKSEILHATDLVKPDDKPSEALRTRTHSSMAYAVKAVASDKAAAVVSAGNTGVFMAMAMFGLKRITGIDRPSICASFPTIRGQTCILDLGANLTASAEVLCQFALLGSEFAKVHFGVNRPTVGILNVGTEANKGMEHLQAAAAILQKRQKPFHHINYYGFIEGDDIPKGTVDVCVTDGFAGNLILKTSEGIGRLMSQKIKQSFRASFFSRLGYLLALYELRKLANFLDPRQYNGAPFLGLNKIAVKSHGGSDKIAFANALQIAHELVQKKIVENVKKNLESLSRS